MVSRNGGPCRARTVGVVALFLCLAGVEWAAAQTLDAVQPTMSDAPITPNQFANGSDSERIEAAIAEGLRTGVNSVAISRMNQKTMKPIWLIDRAILVPSDFTLLLNDCLVRLRPARKTTSLRMPDLA